MRPEDRFKIFNEEEKAEIIKMLKSQFGVEEVPGLLLQRGAERVFLYSGELDENGILELEKTIPVERIGVYFGKFLNDEFRLSIEGTHLLKEQIKKNIFEMNDKQVELWMNGNELNVASGFNGVVAMKYKEDFLGCGKASAEKIGNFVPKNRRLRVKE